MLYPGMILATGLSFLFLLLVFVPLERAYPARKQSFLRPAWWTDLCFFLGQYFIWTSLVLAVIFLLRDGLQSIVPAGIQQFVRSLPLWLQLICAVVLSDFCVYWGHRLQHRFNFLWRFHAVHHSCEHLDWLAAHREHPLDTIFTATMINLPAFIFGFPMESLALLTAFRGMWAIYIHSNVRLPIGPLRMLIGAPELHHWHHSKERHSANFANLSPLMDLMFGTYKCPNHEPPELGIDEPFPRSYLGQLIYPFLPKKRKAPKPAKQEAPAETAVHQSL